MVSDTVMRRTKAFRLPLSFKAVEGRRDKIPHKTAFLPTTTLCCFFLIPSDSRKMLVFKWIKKYYHQQPFQNVEFMFIYNSLYLFIAYKDGLCTWKKMWECEMKLKIFTHFFLFQKQIGKQDYPSSVECSDPAQTRSPLQTLLASHRLSFSLSFPPRRPGSQRSSQRH